MAALMNAAVQRVHDMRNEHYSLFHSYRGRGELVPPWKLPLRGQPPSILMPGMVQTSYPYIPVTKDDVDLDAITDDWLMEPKVRQPYESLRKLRQYFARNYPEMKYNRCLGWGGNGLAAAYDVMSAGGERQRSVVVKMLFFEDRELQQWEVQNSQYTPSKMGLFSYPAHVRHRKAEHIVQLLYADGLGLVGDKVVINDTTRNPDGTLRRSPDSRDTSDEDSDRNGDRNEELPNSKRVRSGEATLNCFITEMLDNGDLASFLKKVRQHRDKIPNPVLWSFLLCFVRMCIGLAYPPADNHDLNNNPGPITETIPTREQDNPRRIVHFDMDPRNIFVGDVLQGANEHLIAPILKLGDFGLATDVLTGKNDFYYERLRQFGKKGYYAPEQFCQDWDYIERDRDFIKDHPLAGNYGVHTNIFAVGYETNGQQLMENLITLSYPAGPPVPTVSRERPPFGKTEYFTYAGHMLQPYYDHVDRDLMTLVLRMQAHFPEDRPTLLEIEPYVTFNISAKGNDGMTEDQLFDWMHKMLYEVPPRSTEAYVASPVIREVIGMGRADPVPDFNFPLQGEAVRPPNSQPLRRGLRPRWRKNGKWVNFRGMRLDD
ncbi:kinase-like domain-containing protein [Xylaria cf. heliscus]|nr:kinase-like domain-containing protein [Xylaria cf. heliscus]